MYCHKCKKEKEGKYFVNGITGICKDCLQKEFDKLAEGENVALFELGKLKVVEAKERQVRENPKDKNSGYKICPAHNVVKYSISAKLKEAVK